MRTKEEYSNILNELLKRNPTEGVGNHIIRYPVNPCDKQVLVDALSAIIGMLMEIGKEHDSAFGPTMFTQLITAKDSDTGFSAGLGIGGFELDADFREYLSSHDANAGSTMFFTLYDVGDDSPSLYKFMTIELNPGIAETHEIIDAIDPACLAWLSLNGLYDLK